MGYNAPVGSMKSAHLQEGDRLDHTPASALTGGDHVNLGKGLWSYADLDIAANAQGAVAAKGVRVLPKASATTFAVGDDVYWDASANLAVQAGLAMEGSEDYLVGVCVVSAANGETGVAVKLLPTPPCRYDIRPIVREFDCEAGTLNEAHVLIPAWMNKTGLLFLGAYALITEVMAGASQDQGIVTVEDGDGNALCTLTPSDAGADAANDVVVGTNDLYSASTGDAAKVVAAGKGVQAKITQKTSGAGAAGMMKVYVRVIPLV